MFAHFQNRNTPMTGISTKTTHRLRTLTAAAILCFGIQQSTAQITIIDGFASACSGTLYDSGGEAGTGYGPGETWELVLCAETPGAAIRLDWVNFTLGAGASIEVFDGFDDTAYSFGALNSGTGGITIQSSYDNVIANGQGCLFLRFISGSGSGTFSANLSCFIPCAAPTAAATFGGPNPLLVCQGEAITFNGSASTAVAPFEIIEYRWDFADGTEDTSGPVVSHAFDEPGEYIVQLYVTDNNSCTNENLVDLQVFVSTTPLFGGSVITPLTICEGEQVSVTAVPQAVTWSALPEANLGGGVILPDGSGVTYTSQLTYTTFAPGATLLNASDLQSICVSMEHSYMGDLIISITCPSGQTMTMHQQGGGGTYIGGANDTDTGSDPVIGECWDYCWSPTATLATWSESAAFGTSPNVMQGGNPSNNALIPGTYSTVEPWSNLTGCDLNGTWTFSIRDMLLADNGFLCDWGLNFNPTLFPSLTQFTPVLGVNSPDSAGWVGNGFVQTPGNLLTGVATPVGVGNFDYVFSVTDNFGCTYDTTITILVNPGIPSPLNIIGDNEICEDAVSVLSAPPGFTGYTWSNSFTGQSISASPGTYTVTVFSGDCSLESNPFVVTGVPSPNPVISGPGFSCGGVPATLTTGEPFASYAWSNGLTTPTITVGSGTYTVTVTNQEGCTSTSNAFSVTIGSDPQAAYSTDPVSPQGIGTTVDFTDLSQGNGSPIVDWEWNLGLTGATSSSPSPTYTYDTPGEYPITLTITTADGCTNTISGTFVILPESIIIPNVFTPNGDGNNEYFVIENGQFYENTLQVFNRWGQEVYETKNYRNGWRAADLPDGTYFYIFTTLRDGKEYTGHLTILR